MKLQKLSLNLPQLRSLLMPASTEVDLWGRGAGKSTNIGLHSERMLHEFPRASFLLYGLTYTQLLTITLAEVVGTWERLGYKEGIHFFVRKKPPQKWNWPRPLHAPVSYDYFIPWYNGSGFYLGSQDVSVRGINAHGLYADEAALLDLPKMTEQALPAIRGDASHFDNHPLLHFEKYVSSKPIGSRGSWLLEMGKYYEEDGKNYDIISRQLVDLKYKLITSTDQKVKRETFDLIVQKKKLLKWYVSAGGVFYNEADAFDNLSNLGAKWFDRQRKITSPIKMRVEVLNETLRNAEAGFYPNFKEDKHCYYDTDNNGYILDTLGIDHRNKGVRDCRWDSDLLRDEPLFFAADWGASINWITVYQRHPGKLRKIINCFWVLSPDILDHVFRKAGEYYNHTRNKLIYLYYDRTGNSAKDNSTITSAQQAAIVLRSFGFTVILMTEGKAPRHELKYLLANKVLLEEDTTLPYFRINGNRCKQLITSMLLAAVIQSSSGERKDKRPEQDENFPQEDATHGSDTLDTIFEAEASFSKSDAWMDMRST